MLETPVAETYRPGLQGVVAAETRLSRVDGERGELIIAGFPVEELAENAAFEETLFLLWNDRLPSAVELGALRRELAALRRLPDLTLDLLATAAAQQADPMDALRMAAGTIGLAPGFEQGRGDANDGIAAVAALPTIVAVYARLSRGQAPIAPRSDLGHAANYLYMLTGDIPSRARTRALEAYWNTVVDHGLNASTFTARVIVSTGSDILSAVVGAIGALKGPLHGGAPGPALDVVFEIGSAQNAEPYIRAKLERGERLMGFGHRIYRVRDPRADVLARAAERLYATDLSDGTADRLAGRPLYDLALAVEETALRLLEEYKPGRRLQTNVEFYTALVLDGVGLETEQFAPTFACARAGGWVAHALEQRRAGRIIRPDSVYVGALGRTWTAIGSPSHLLTD